MAKKAKAADEIQPTRSKEEIFKLHHPDILKAKIALEEKEKEAASLRGVYRNLLKAYGKAGGNAKAMAQIMQLRKEDPDQLTRDYRDLNDHCVWGNIPIGAQLDIFGGGPSPADAAEREQMGGDESGNVVDAGAYHEGEQASQAGKNRDSHSYNGTSPKQKLKRRSWELGWDEDQAARVMALGGKGGEPVHA